jgi:NAD(P)-dependent dehydrogenase (short-subunit alcohol dehydrogenase family)
MFDLSGRIALVTGAGQGIGAGIAATLAESGATVVVNDLVAERAEASAAAVRDAGGRASAAAFDVTDHQAVDAAVAAIAAEVGPVDVLVNNAGIPADASWARRFADSQPAEWRLAVDLNLYGVMNCCRAVLPAMTERGWGRIVVISSGAAVEGLDIGVSAYAAGKGGALAFMRHLARETARQGVTANALVLGLMETAAGFMSPNTVPVGRLGTGRDVGAACVWLAAEGSWVTGQSVGVNGGSSMRG